MRLTGSLDSEVKPVALRAEDAHVDTCTPPQSETCPFCPAWLRTSASLFDEEFGHGPEVRLLPALGMLVPGYLLATATEHRVSFAELGAPRLEQTERWLAHVTEALQPVFGRYLAFEHGSCGEASAGACIDHAHIHLVPLADQLGEQLANTLEWQELPALAALERMRGRPYVYLGVGGRHFVVADPDLPSQWLRRKIAAHLGHDLWDWAIDDGLGALRVTLAQLSAAGVEL